MTLHFNEKSAFFNDNYNVCKVLEIAKIIILQTVQEHLSPFWRGITRAWVGILSSLGVFSERGRFEVFFEVSWIHLS